MDSNVLVVCFNFQRLQSAHTQGLVSGQKLHFITKQV